MLNMALFNPKYSTDIKPCSNYDRSSGLCKTQWGKPTCGHSNNHIKKKGKFNFYYCDVSGMPNLPEKQRNQGKKEYERREDLEIRRQHR
jgi:hypothetical protein